MVDRLASVKTPNRVGLTVTHPAPPELWTNAKHDMGWGEEEVILTFPPPWPLQAKPSWSITLRKTWTEAPTLRCTYKVIKYYDSRKLACRLWLGWVDVEISSPHSWFPRLLTFYLWQRCFKQTFSQSYCTELRLTTSRGSRWRFKSTGIWDQAFEIKQRLSDLDLPINMSLILDA